MSDTDLALFLGTEDGLWHPQTKAAMKQFATTNIELNREIDDMVFGIYLSFILLFFY